MEFPRRPEISDHSKKLLQRMTEPDPEKRISWNEFFHHGLFTELLEQARNEELNASGDQKEENDK